VTGIDFAPAMVAETAKELAACRMANAEVQQMDAEYLEFPDAAFDYVLCGFGIFFFPQLGGAMAEIGRVLKPNGRIGVTTWGNTFREQINWFEELVKAYLAPGSQASAAPAQPSAGQQPIFDTPAGLEAILQAAGFTEIRVVAEDTEFVYATKDEFWSSLWSHGMRAQLERIEQMKGPDGLQRFKREVFSRADAVQQSDGIHQQFPVLYALAAKAAN
jgi:SAM-dependent methyltransferase